MNKSTWLILFGSLLAFCLSGCATIQRTPEEQKEIDQLFLNVASRNAALMPIVSGEFNKK
jgi:hypothetical protein